MIYNLLNRSKQNILPKASEVLHEYLRQQNYPYWSAYFVKYKTIINDQFFQTCFLVNIDKKYDYLILRTGCFPFIKYHCSRLSSADHIDLSLIKYENHFYNLIKLINLGIPTLAYGIGGMLLSTHTETVRTSKGDVQIYFWYKENRNSPH